MCELFQPAGRLLPPPRLHSLAARDAGAHCCMSGGKALVTTGVGLGLLVYMMPESKATFNVPVSITPSRSLHALVETSPLELEPPGRHPGFDGPFRPHGRPSKPVPPSDAAAPLLPEGCGADGECTVEALVRKYAVDNTVVVTFGNDKQRHFTENWVYHLQQLGVGGLLVGMMSMQPSQPTYVTLAARLRAQGVGVYTVNSAQVAVQPQVRA
jgi:hypothetical protein